MAAKDFNNFLHVHLIEEGIQKDYIGRYMSRVLKREIVVIYIVLDNMIQSM